MDKYNETDESDSSEESSRTSRSLPLSRRGALKLGGVAALGPWLYPGTAAAQQVYDIDEPGRLTGYNDPDGPTVEYRLTRDLTDVDEDVCFRIVGHNVVLNGNGHTIDGNDVGGVGVEVTERATNAVVRNLRIRRFANYLGGVFVDNGAGGTTGVYDCVIERQRNGPGMYIRADSSDVVGNYVVRCGGTGLAYNAQRDPEHAIADNGFFFNEGSGISFLGLLDSGTVTVRGNVVVGNQEHGILMNHRAATLENNTVMNNEANGISARDDSTLLTNSVSGNGEIGLRLQGDGSRVEGNTLTGNGLAAVTVQEGEDFTFRDNVVAGSTYGMLCSVGDSTFENNRVTGCSWGLLVGWGDSNRVVDNEFRNNAIGLFVSSSDANEIRDNVLCNFTENVRVRGSSGNTISGNQEC